MKIINRPKLVRESLVALVSMLCAANAWAISYSIRPNYEGGMCTAIRDAFAEGLVLDATRPLCERRFELSPKAKRLGLSNVDKELLPRSSYLELLRKMIAITGNEKGAQPVAVRERNEKIAERLSKDKGTKIYRSHFDADNSGEFRTVYIDDYVSCDISDYYADGSVTTYIEKENGAFDPSWGVRDVTAGIPFIYDRHTYYLRWKSLKGSMDKNALAQINIYNASEYGGYFTKISSYNVFPPPVCIIYQTKKRALQ